MNKKEYIEKESVLYEINKRLQDPMYWHEGEDWKNGLILACDVIDERPTADVEEIVRCKDCQYKSEWVKNGIGEYFCRKSGLWNLTDTCFCHCGSRKEDV